MSAHTHNFDGHWPFSQAENTVAFCCEHVFQRERPILCVSHDHGGDWQFLCGDDHSDGEPRLICMGCALEIDGTLVAVADLPAGWAAEREVLGDEWSFVERAEPEEEFSDDA